MNKERIKSGVLIILVITNFILAGKVLINKRLWPSGYNFFINLRQTFKKSDVSTASHLASPLKIIVNTGYQSSRFEYQRNLEYFGNICDSAASVFKQAFSHESSQISSDEWYSVLTAKSVYFSYPCEYSLQTFSKLFGINLVNSEDIRFSNLVISETGSVYIENSANNTYIKFENSSTEISPIITKVSDEYPEEESIINYSFDLNFDKVFGNEKTFLSPLIPVYSAPISSQQVISENPLKRSDGEIDHNKIKNILISFSINPNAVSSYTESDGTFVFVENNSILKVSPNGRLDFKASDSGLKISTTSNDSICTDATNLAAFIDNLNSGADTQKDMIMTSPLVESGKHSFTFDYVFDGLAVTYQNSNAISASLENGRIKEYHQILRKYIGTENFEDSPLYIEALDNSISLYQNSMNEIHITKMYLSYIDDLSIGTKSADWRVVIDNVIAE